MSLEFSLKEGITYSRMDTEGRVLSDSHFFCDLITAFKADSLQLFRNTIGIFSEYRIDFSLKMPVNLIAKLCSDSQPL